jgi:hypothetical protein
LGIGEFLPHDKIIQWLSKYGCELVTTEEKICEEEVFVITGFDEEQFNMVSCVHLIYRNLRVNIRVTSQHRTRGIILKMFGNMI